MSLFGSKKQNEIDKLVSENDELKNQLHSVLLKHGGYEDLENNLARVKKELSDLQQRDETMYKNLAAHEAGVSEKQKYLGDLNSKILELEEIKESLLSTVTSYDSQVSLLEERAKELDEKAAHSAEIEIKLAAISEKKNKLDQDVAEKEQTFAYLSTIEREIQGELDKERNQLDAVKNQITGLSSEIEALNEARMKSEEVIVSLKQQEKDAAAKINLINEEEIKKSAYVKSLDEKISLNEEIKSNLEKTLSDLVSQLGRNENTYLEQSEKREIIQTEILALRKERDDLDNKINLAKEQFELFQAEASKHTTLLSTLGEEVRRFESMRDDLKDEIEKLALENEKYSSELEGKKGLLNDLEYNLKGLEELHLRTEKEFGSVVEKYMLDFEDVKKIKEELEAGLKEKKEEENILDKSLLEKKTFFAEKEAMIKILEKENLGLTNKIDSLKSDKEDLNSEIARLKDNLSSSHSQLTTLKYETDALQLKKSDIQRDISFFMTQIGREYSEAELKLKAVNESISSGNIAYLELNERISSAKAVLKNLAPRIEDEEIIETGNGAFNPGQKTERNGREIDPDTEDDPNSFGFNPFSLPPNLNDD